jgi:hypothetical protein
VRRIAHQGAGHYQEIMKDEPAVALSLPRRFQGETPDRRAEPVGARLKYFGPDSGELLADAPDSRSHFVNGTAPRPLPSCVTRSVGPGDLSQLLEQIDFAGGRSQAVDVTGDLIQFDDQ